MATAIALGGCAPAQTGPAGSDGTGGNGTATGGSGVTPPVAGSGGNSPGTGGGNPAAAGSGGVPPGASGTGGHPTATGGSSGSGGAAGSPVGSGGGGAPASTGGGGAAGAGGVRNGGSAGGVAGAASGGAGGSAGVAGALGFSTDGDGDFQISSPFNLPPQSTRLDPGVTAGRIEQFTWTQSVIYPNTSRLIRVYIPAGHDGSQPSALSVLQDGGVYVEYFRLPMVLDNLIAAGAVPSQVAVFIDSSPSGRSREYDCLNDTYFNFITREILPEVERRYSVQLSTDPWQRAIGGHSSGGSAAFTVGWRHPESFRRILTHNGSFTSLCAAGSPSANTYPGLIAAAEPKPLRVFLLTGTNDIGAGSGGTRDWVKANRDVAAALKAKSYHYRFVFANGGSHAHNAGGSILPETIRWLWRRPGT